MTVNLSLGCTERTIDIHFPYSATTISELKAGVSGARWFKSGKHWHAPLDMETCRALRRTFPNLNMDDTLRAWAFTAKRQEDTLGSLALAVDAQPMQRLHKVLPRLHDAVWLGPLGRYMTEEQRIAGLAGPGSFQAADVQFVAQAPAPLIGNEQGTGKTLTWIAAVWEAGMEDGCHLVVAPKAAVDGTWLGELKRWQEDAPKKVEVFVCVDDRKQREATIAQFHASTAPVRWLVVNPAMVAYTKDKLRTSKKCIAVNGPKAQLKACHCKARKGPHEHYVSPYPFIHETTWRTLCIDEAHKGSVRNHRSITSKGMFDIPYAAAPHGKKTTLTGTPMKKHGGHDIWGLLNWLRPDVFTSSWRFWGEYFVIIEDDYGKKVGPLREDRRDAFFRMLQPYMLRRLKKEVAPWLPEKMYVPVDCFMSKKQADQYSAMEQEGAYEFGDDGSVTTTGILAKFTRLKQFANAYCKLTPDGRLEPVESCKLDALIAKMDEADMFEEGETRKQLVFSQSREMINFTAAALRDKGLKVEIISGKDNNKSAQRMALIEAFQHGDLRVLCIVTTAGGVSLTLDAASEVHLLDEMWSPDEDVQAEDRAHRVSRIHQVTVFIYRTVGTIDSYVQDTKEAKAVTHSFILDVRRQIMAKHLASA